MVPVVLSMATFFSTIIGGLTALKYKNWLHRIMGYTAGVLLGVVAFDILPETLNITNRIHLDFIKPMIALVFAFLFFHILEKTILMHQAHEEEYGKHIHPKVGLASALALSGHSFLDGVGIGLGFQAGTSVGIAVAVAVIAHDFTDGMNTVILMLRHKNTDSRARKMLLLDAIAPVLGAASTLLFSLSDQWLVLYLGFFAGFLLYIGASDILPQAHSRESSRATIALTVLGALFMFVVTRYV